MILGISPGTETFAFALIKDGEVKYWIMKSFKGRWSRKKLKIIITTLENFISKHEIQQVAIKIPNVLPIFKGYMQLIGAINLLLIRKGIKPHYYTLSEIQKECGIEKMGRDQMVDFVVAHYPFLLPYTKTKKDDRLYYLKLFEAVAVVHVNKLRNTDANVSLPF